MKTLSSFLIIFIFTTTTLHSPAFSNPQAARGCNQVVCDTHWLHVEVDKHYRLGPYFRGETFDIKLESTVDDHPCPRNAVQVKEDSLNPEYFSFTRIIDDKYSKLLQVKTPFLISVVKKSGSCNETDDRYLRVTPRNDQLGISHLTGDGEVKTWSSCFQFDNFPLRGDESDRYAATYMLELCPGKCEVADPGSFDGPCYHIGNVTNGEHVYLQEGGYPFEFSLREEDFDNLDAYV